MHADPAPALLQLRCPKCGALHHWRGLTRPNRRQGSIVATAACGDCGYRVFVKTLLATADEAAEQRASHEFETASRLHTAVRESEPRLVPRPIALRGSGIVFEFVEGQTMLQLLRRESPERKRQVMQDAGAWFARFHSAGLRGVGSGDFAEKYAVIAGRCSDDGHAPAVALAALDRLGSTAGPFSSRREDLVAVHGDAKPANFMIADGRIVAVDVDGHFSNVREMDLAQFLVQTDIALAGPLGAADDRLIDDLEPRFLQGYSERTPIHAEALEWWKVYFWLSFWMSARRQGAIRRYRLGSLCQRRVESTLAGVRRSMHHPRA